MPEIPDQAAVIVTNVLREYGATANIDTDTLATNIVSALNNPDEQTTDPAAGDGQPQVDEG